MILQRKVRGKLLNMDAIFLAEEFTIDLNLLTHLTSLQWAMVSPDFLEMGCLGNALLFTNSDLEESQRINKQLQLIQSRGATPSLTNAQMHDEGQPPWTQHFSPLHPPYTSPLLCWPSHCSPDHHFPWGALLSHEAFDPGWAHHMTFTPLLSSLKGIYHLQWLSLCLT